MGFVATPVARHTAVASCRQTNGRATVHQGRTATLPRSALPLLRNTVIVSAECPRPSGLNSEAGEGITAIHCTCDGSLVDLGSPAATNAARMNLNLSASARVADRLTPRSIGDRSVFIRPSKDGRMRYYKGGQSRLNSGQFRCRRLPESTEYLGSRPPDH